MIFIINRGELLSSEIGWGFEGLQHGDTIVSFIIINAGMRVCGHAELTPSESLREAGVIPFANMMELKSISIA